MALYVWASRRRHRLLSATASAGTWLLVGRFWCRTAVGHHWHVSATGNLGLITVGVSVGRAIAFGRRTSSLNHRPDAASCFDKRARSILRAASASGRVSRTRRADPSRAVRAAWTAAMPSQGVRRPGRAGGHGLPSDVLLSRVSAPTAPSAGGGGSCARDLIVYDRRIAWPICRDAVAVWAIVRRCRREITKPPLCASLSVA
jgi:hypothetical protein